MICFTLAFFAVALATSLIIGGIIVDEVRDIHGEIVRDLDGQPKVTVNQWQTFLLNWRAHTFVAVATVLIMIPAFLHVRQLYRWIAHRSSHRIP